jgi:hypothetical protein
LSAYDARLTEAGWASITYQMALRLAGDLFVGLTPGAFNPIEQCTFTGRKSELATAVANWRKRPNSSRLPGGTAGGAGSMRDQHESLAATAPSATAATLLDGTLAQSRVRARPI